MYSSFLLVVPIVAGIVNAQDLENGDFPASCSSSCSPVASRSTTCDNRFNDDDQGQLNCVCNGNNMDSLIPECLSCLAPYQNNDDYDYNDVNDLLNGCGFSAIAPSNATKTESAASASTTVYTTTFTSTDDDGEVETETEGVTSVITGGAGVASSRGAATTRLITISSNGEATVITSVESATRGGNAANTGGSSSDEDVASPSGNMAAATAAPMIGAGAGAILAAMAAF